MQYAHYLDNLPKEEPTSSLFPFIISLIDLTTLNDNDDESSIAIICEKAQTLLGNVAAVCLYPPFIKLAASMLNTTPINIATVVNFPEGTTSLDQVLITMSQAIEDGANEIDVVFPYSHYLAHEKAFASQFIAACKALCPNNITLKVILETGALQQPTIIAEAARDALNAGADFIKTSTGKIANGATPLAAAVMLLVIKELTPLLKRPLGLKISGGIREIDQITPYLALIHRIMGPEWISSTTCRIGTSQLVDNLLQKR